MQTRSFLPAAVLLAIPTFVSAQEQLAQLDPILVTPTRTAQTTDQTLASVTVIDREEIERLQPKEFVELLRGRAGISVLQNGPFGKTSSVFMRGTNSDHTLLLVDGVRMGSATTGGASWQFLPLSEIERVEIVRGPRTSLYGSDAIGGVIQVFTREGDGPARFRAKLSGGSFNTWDLGAGLSGSTESTRYNLSVSHFTTYGIDVQDESGDAGRDGYDNTSLSIRLSHELDGGAEVFGTLLHSEGESEFDATDKDWYDFRHGASSLGIRGQLTERWHSTLKVAHSIDESERFGGISSKFNTARDVLDWQNDVTIGQRHLLTLGLDYQDDQVDVSDNYVEKSRDNVGIYAQWQAYLDRQDFAVSIRRDDNEAFGYETTGQVAWGVQLDQEWSFHASYGTAFKAPTFNELYTPFIDFSQFGFPGSYAGNPDLRPEVSETYELGVTFDYRELYFETAIFETHIDNLIVNAGGVDRRPENVKDARIRGIESNIRWENDSWSAVAALTHLQHEDRDSGNKLNRRPDNIMRLELDRYWDAYSVGATVVAEGSRYDDVDNENRLGGFALLDLRVSYRITPEWRLSGKIQNALDKDYATVEDYNQPGRAFFVTLNYQQQ